MRGDAGSQCELCDSRYFRSSRAWHSLFDDHVTEDAPASPPVVAVNGTAAEARRAPGTCAITVIPTVTAAGSGKAWQLNAIPLTPVVT